jgi:hypothetical protein
MKPWQSARDRATESRTIGKRPVAANDPVFSTTSGGKEPLLYRRRYDIQGEALLLRELRTPTHRGRRTYVFNRSQRAELPLGNDRSTEFRMGSNPVALGAEEQAANGWPDCRCCRVRVQSMGGTPTSGAIPSGDRRIAPSGEVPLRFGIERQRVSTEPDWLGERIGKEEALCPRLGLSQPANDKALTRNVEGMTNDAMSPLFLAAIEATEEAVYNSMFKATTMTGNGHTVEALPIEKTVEILREHRVIK